MLKVEFKYELAVPKDKSQIPMISYSSSEDNNDNADDEEEEENNQ